MVQLITRGILNIPQVVRRVALLQPLLHALFLLVTQMMVAVLFACQLANVVWWG